MLSRIKQLLLLTEADLNSNSVTLLQQSVLRIILYSGVLLVLGIVLHSSWQAYQLNAWVVIIITGSFYLTLLLAIYLSSRKLQLSKAILLLIIFGAGLCMTSFIDNAELAKVGLLFVYTAPLIALLCFSTRITITVMVLNVIPFLFLLFSDKPVNLFDLSITLPATPIYVHSLLFLFFNLCIPLAVMRVFSTLKRNALTLGQQNQLISQSNQLYQDIFNQRSKASVLLNANGDIVKANNKARQILRVGAAEHCHISELLQTTAVSDMSFWQGHDIECMLTSDSAVHVLLNHMCTIEQQHHLIQLDDITPLKQLHMRLAKNNQKQDLWRNYDDLTTLPNHNFFLQLVKQHPSETGSLMVIVRLCHIKAFNQQHGYHSGDELLAAFAAQLKAAVPDDVITARLRGVKFVLWRPLSGGNTSVATEANRLISFLPQQLQLSVGTITPVFEAGVSMNSRQHASAEQTLEQCESALEQADAYNCPLAFFQPDTLQQRNAELQLLNEFKTALQHNTPELWLQPKVKPDGVIESFEALLRWQKADGSFAAPDKIVALAEQYGLIAQLSSYVLNKAVSIIKRFRQHKLHYAIAINLTGSDLLAAPFYNELVHIATHQPALLEQLTLELTENSIAKHQQPLFDKLHALKRLGYTLALDDFGTGQASLSMLNKLPVDTVKLDRSFLLNVPTDTRQTQLVQSVMQMTKALKLKLVIEGVETELQQRFLTSLGAEQLQGYWFSKPMPVAYWLVHFNEMKAKQNQAESFAHRVDESSESVS